MEALQRVLVDLGVGMPINESLARYAGSLEKLDADFADYARKQAQALAPEADWSQPELPRRATSTMIGAWLNDHPRNYAALARFARQLMNEGKWDEAKSPLEEMRKLYPQDETASGALSMLAEVHRELKNVAEERAVLSQLAQLSDDDVEMFTRLTELATKAEDWPAVKKHATRWLAVNPLSPGPHRAAISAAEASADDALAIDSYRALLLLDPFDPAEIHLKLAGLLQRKGDLALAKRHALLALEETPRYRAAHERLLAIVKKMSENAEKEPGTDSQGPEGRRD
jgi:tetratricopeptide (TPR) repeat protein